MFLTLINKRHLLPRQLELSGPTRAHSMLNKVPTNHLVAAYLENRRFIGWGAHLVAGEPGGELFW